jgi:hypothetical protein
VIETVYLIAADSRNRIIVMEVLFLLIVEEDGECSAVPARVTVIKWQR